MGKLYAQKISGNQLCAVCLGGRHRDLRTCQCVENMICLTRNRGTHYIDNRHRRNALALCQTQGCQAVGCLARLADDNNQTVLFQNRVPVTELGSQLDADRNTRQIFDHILRCHACMVSRTTRYDINTL